MEFAHWLELLAPALVSLAGACAIIILLDILAGHPQRMWVMNVAWPVTALGFGHLTACPFIWWGRLAMSYLVNDWPLKRHFKEAT